MKTVIYWANMALFEAMFWALFFAWQLYGIEGAGNAFLFIGWFFGALGIIAGCALDKTSYKPRPRGAQTYANASALVASLAMAWVGYFWLATVWLIAHFMVAASREREPKPKDEQAEGRAS